MACGHVCERWLIDVGGPGPLWEAPFPRQAVLGCRGKLVKHEPVSEPASVSSKVPASGCSLSSCPDFAQ